MKKRLVVDVLIDDTVSEEEVLTRVDDILADCALRPAEFTDLELDPNNPIVWDDEDDPANIPGWQPSPGTALDYVYRKKYLDKHNLSESKKYENWPPKAQAVFDRLAGINDSDALGWGEYFKDSGLWGDTDFRDGCCFAFTDNFNGNDPYWNSYNEDDFEDDSDFIEYVKGNKKLFNAAKADLDAYVKAYYEDDEDLDESYFAK